MKKNITIASAFAALMLSGTTASACIGGQTNITSEQVNAVVKAVRGDYSVNYAGIVGIRLNGNEVVVTLKSDVDGLSTRVYKTKYTADAGPGNCDKQIAERIR